MAAGFPWGCGHCLVLPGYQTTPEIFSGSSGISFGAFRLRNREYVCHLQHFGIIAICIMYCFVAEGKSGVREITECFLSLMDSTELNLALRGCAATIHETAATISVSQ